MQPFNHGMPWFRPRLTAWNLVMSLLFYVGLPGTQIAANCGITRPNKPVTPVKVEAVSDSCVLQLSTNFGTSDIDRGCFIARVLFQGWGICQCREHNSLANFPKCVENTACHLAVSECQCLFTGRHPTFPLTPFGWMIPHTLILPSPIWLPPNLPIYPSPSHLITPKSWLTVFINQTTILILDMLQNVLWYECVLTLGLSAWSGQRMGCNFYLHKNGWYRNVLFHLIIK